MNSIFYIILIITIVSYLLGLFLSHFEKKGKISILSQMGNAGFVNIYGINKPIPEYDNEKTIQMEPIHEEIEFKEELPVQEVITQQEVIPEPVVEKNLYMDDEIL